MTIITNEKTQKIVKNTKGRAMPMELAKKRHILNKPARATVWYISAAALARGVGVLGTPVFTRLLSPSEYGIFPLYNTWMALFTVITTLGITGGIALAGLSHFRDRREDYISASTGLLAALLLFFTLVYLIASPVINALTGLSTPLTLVMLIQIFALGITNLYYDGEKYLYRYAHASLLTVFSSLLSPILSVYIITYTDLRGEGRILGAMLAALISAIPIFAAILRQSSRLLDTEIWKYIIKRAAPLLPHYLSCAVILRVGEATVGRVFGTVALGKYSVALSLGLSLSVVTGGLISAVGPWVLRKLKQNNVASIKEILLVITRSLALFSLLVLSFAPEAMKILTPPEYHDCLIAVYPLSLSMIPSFLSSVLTQGEMYYSRSVIMNLPTVTAAGVSTLLSLILLPRLDYRFVALFVLLSYVTMLIINVFIFKRIAGEIPICIESTALIFALAMLYGSILAASGGNFALRVILAIPLIPLLLIEGKRAYSLVREK